MRGEFDSILPACHDIATQLDTWFMRCLQQGYCPCVGKTEEARLATRGHQASMSVLDAAVRSGNLKLVTYLLEELRCPVNETTEQIGSNALHTAVRFEAYLTSNPHISHVVPREKIAQMREDALQIIQLLAEHGCDINLRDRSVARQLLEHPLQGHTPLGLAFKQGDWDRGGLLKLLISLGADVNLPASTGMPLIQLAVAMNEIELLGALLTGNFQDLNTVMNSEFSLLHVATIVRGMKVSLFLNGLALGRFFCACSIR